MNLSHFYTRRICPCLCDLMMRGTFLAPYRRDALAGLKGDVLEIGFGTGLNLPYYPSEVQAIHALDPNGGMSRRAKERMARSAIPVALVHASAERLPFPDGTFDCVVSTWTMCSVPGAGRALSEIYRVLKPGGRYHFLEHGLSTAHGVQKWQHRLTPIQKRLAGGCRLDLDMETLLAQQPFAHVDLRRFVLAGAPRLYGSMFGGAGVK